MGLRVDNNIASLKAYRNLSVTDGQMNKSLEKLSSGFRINRAADDETHCVPPWKGSYGKSRCIRAAGRAGVALLFTAWGGCDLRRTGLVFARSRRPWPVQAG